MTTWKPGDVAHLTYTFVEGGIALRVTGCAQRDHSAGDHWHFATNGRHGDGSGATTIRPLVVIDPESAEDVKRLADAFCHARWSHIEGSDECDPLTRSSMHAALREFAAPTPPKPAEPTGLGAVVEDATGDVWVRFKSAEIRPWRLNFPGPSDAASAPQEFYRNIAVVRVLSEGIQ